MISQPMSSILSAFVVIAAVVLLGMRIGLVAIGDFFEKLAGDRKVSDGPGLLTWQHFPTKGNGTQPRGPASQLHSLHLGTQQIGSLQRAPFNFGNNIHEAVTRKDNSSIAQLLLCWGSVEDIQCIYTTFNTPPL